MSVKIKELEKYNVILASKSPRRKELLSLICDSFTVCPADIDESIPEGVLPEAASEYIAVKKALAIETKALIISCDTVVIVDSEILGKPINEDDAFSMLKKLSGKTHSVISGVCIMFDGRSLSFSQKTSVSFYSMTDDDIWDYIKSGEPFDKAGSYGIQGLGGVFVKEIEGDYYNVVGLPVAKLRKAILAFIAN